MVVTLGAVTFFARDVDALAGFYAAALGLAATVDDSPRYRELSGGGARIGFAFSGAYDLLSLQDQAEPSGLRSILTFLIGGADGMDAAVARAVGAGAILVKPPYATHFGAWMAVLRDPEGNAFRLSADAPA
jgi:predicted enzyme related to lactoylglutathione lyase